MTDVSRRRLLKTIGAGVGATSLAGCTRITRRTFEATAFGLTAEAALRFGFANAVHRLDRQTRRESLGFADLEVTILSHLLLYDPAGSDLPGFGVFSTPDANVFGQPRNPLVGVDLRRLLVAAVYRTLLRRLLDVAGLDAFTGWAQPPEAVREVPLGAFDGEATAKTFSGVANADGGEHAVILNLVQFDAGPDEVLVASGRSKELDDGESGPEDVFSDAEIDLLLGAFVEAVENVQEVDPDQVAAELGGSSEETTGETGRAESDGYPLIENVGEQPGAYACWYEVRAISPDDCVDLDTGDEIPVMCDNRGNCPFRGRTFVRTCGDDCLVVLRHLPDRPQCEDVDGEDVWLVTEEC